MGNCYNYTPIPPAEASCIIARMIGPAASEPYTSVLCTNTATAICGLSAGAKPITYDGSSARVTIKGEEVRYYGKQRTLAAIRAGQCRPPALRP